MPTQLSLSIPDPVHAQLKQLAARQRTSMKNLTLLALDKLFKDAGLSSIEELTDSTETEDTKRVVD